MYFGEFTLVPMRARVWGVEIRPGDQEVALKKPNEAGTRVALWEQKVGTTPGGVVKAFRTSPFLPAAWLPSRGVRTVL